MAQMVKNLPDNARDPGSIPFLFPRDPSRKDPLEKEMATRSSILTWEISWTEEPGGLQDHKESGMTVQLTLSLSYFDNNTKTLVFAFSFSHESAVQFSRGYMTCNITVVCMQKQIQESKLFF